MSVPKCLRSGPAPNCAWHHSTGHLVGLVGHVQKRPDGRTSARNRPQDSRNQGNHGNRRAHRRRFKPDRMQWLAIAVPAAATIIGAVIVVLFAR